MPLSAAFHFFSPFHSKKKYHIQPFSLSSIFSSPSYLSLLFSFHSSVNSLSAPIFVILLNTIKK